MRVFKIIIAVILATVLSVPAGADLDFVDGDAARRREVRHQYRRDNNISAGFLQQYLVDGGFLDSRVTGTGSDLTVQFGPLYYLDRLKLGGDVEESLEINRPFERRYVRPLIDSIVQSLQAGGHYYARLRVERYDRRDEYLTMTATVQTGPRVTVDDIEIIGLTRTDPNLIRKYITIAKGNLLLPTTLEESTDLLRRLDFVAPAAPPEILPETGYDRVRLRYYLRENRRFYFEGSGGYVPDDDGYFSYYLDFRMRNFLGGGRFLGTTVDHREKNISLLSVKYRQPVFLVGRGEAEISLATRDYRDRFYEFRLAAAASVAFGRSFKLTVSAAWKNVEPADDLSPSFEVYSVGMGLSSGTYEATRTRPTQLAFSWQIDYLNRRYKHNEATGEALKPVYNDTRNELTVEASTGPVGTLIAFTRLRLLDVESGEKPLPFSERVLFGGPATLRGYRNDQFSARRLILGQLEPRMFLGSLNYGYLFYDLAYSELYGPGTDGNSAMIDDIRSGLGLGFRVASGERSLRLELAWGDGVSPDQPRLHVSFINRF